MGEFQKQMAAAGVVRLTRTIIWPTLESLRFLSSIKGPPTVKSEASASNVEKISLVASSCALERLVSKKK